MSRPMCVLDHNGDWHALTGRLDPEAALDEVRCGVVVMRFASRRRRPSCVECCALNPEEA